MNYSKISKKTWAGLALIVVATAGALLFGGQSASAQSQTQMIQDCSANSIIKCGAASPADLIGKIRADDSGDLTALYEHFGLGEDRYDEFAREAKMGMAYRNGEIKVDGKVVARNAWSIGRSQKSYSEAYKVGDVTYHRSDSTEVLRQDLPVMVWFDEQGKLEVAVLAACGNPMGGDRLNPGTPSQQGNVTCRQLRAQPVVSSSNSSSTSSVRTSASTASTSASTATRTTTVPNANNQGLTYRFSVDAPAVSGATISRVVYDFGDGSTEEREDPAEEVEHSFVRAGSFNVKATIYATTSDGREITVNGSGCTKRLTVRQPARPATSSANWKCTSLSVSRALASDSNATGRADDNTTTSSDNPPTGDDGDNTITDATADSVFDDNTGDDRLSYTLRANASSSNARLVSADFDFGDGSTASRVEVEGTSNNISVDHTYAEAGNYTASATLYFEPESGTVTEGKDASAVCEKAFTISRPPAQPSPPAPQPEEQPELPATGAAGVIGIFGGASALGTLGYRWRARRQTAKVDQLISRL